MGLAGVEGVVGVMGSQELKNVASMFSDGDWVESKDQDPEGSVRLIQLADIGDGVFIDKSKRFMNIETAKRLNCTFLNKNDILIARMPDPLGRCCLFPFDEREKYVTVVDIAILRVLDSYSKSYLQYMINTPQVRHDIEGQTTGTTRKRITRKKLEKLKIPLPPLAEQQKIAAILDAADQLRQKNQQLIDHYSQLSQSLFLEMFGDPVTNPKGWDSLCLEGMLEFLTSGSRGWAKYYSENGDLFLRIQNVGKNKLILDDVAYVQPPDSAEAKRTIVNAGDILLSITADLGRTAVIPENIGKAYINQHLAIIRLKDKYDPYYVSEYISSVGGERQFSKLDKGGVKAGLNFTDIKSLNILNPPIERQKQYLERVQKIQAQKQQAQASLEKSEALFNSLLQRAFKGELTSNKARAA